MNIPINVCRGLLIVIAGVILFYLATEYFNKNSDNDSEKFVEQELLGIEEDDHDDVLEDTNKYSAINNQNNTYQSEEVKPTTDNVDDPQCKHVNYNNEHNKLPNDCFPKDKLTAEDLLPKDSANSQWAQVNPAGQGELKNKNFLTAGYHVGVNTVGSTLRNANMQLRSEPPNPQMKVSPWNQTTINPDLNRRPLEINGCE